MYIILLHELDIVDTVLKLFSVIIISAYISIHSTFNINWHKYQQLNLKNKSKNKLSKQLEQEQHHRNGDHMEGYQWGRGGGEWEEMYRGLEA